MAIQQVLATVRSDGTLKLPPEAQDSLHLKAGEQVVIHLDRGVSETQQEIHKALDLQTFFAEADAIERQSASDAHSHKTQIVDETAEKHRRMGMKISC